MISIIGATHPGQREHNEDCFEANTELGLGLVADGMGGYACGEVASDLVKTTIVEADNDTDGLPVAILRAHNAVREAADADAGKKGMGSTAIAVKMRELDYDLAWVGDSRAYLWDGASELKQITRDHSYVESLLTTGAISYEEAINHPNRNLITQAVGVEAEGGLEIGHVKGRLCAGQQLILCSDGLVDEVLDIDIAKILHKAESPEEALNNLVRAAVVAGGHDNITVVIVTVDAATASSQGGIEPEVIRSTSLDSNLDEPTQQRPEPSADITQMGMPVIDDADLEAEPIEIEPGSLRLLTAFVANNMTGLVMASCAIVLMVAGLYYYS